MTHAERAGYLRAIGAELSVSFGGFKQSGIGREGLLPFLETKFVILEGRPAGYEHTTLQRRRLRRRTVRGSARRGHRGTQLRRVHVRSGGELPLPALVLDPAPSLKIVAEEQFGPALPVIPYDSEAEAVALANQTWSGLCSSVWSADTEHAMKIAGQLRTGVTFFNNHNATAVDERAPFGGFNASGIGREELGPPGYTSSTETHVMAVPSGS